MHGTVHMSEEFCSMKEHIKKTKLIKFIRSSVGLHQKRNKNRHVKFATENVNSK